MIYFLFASSVHQLSALLGRHYGFAWHATVLYTMGLANQRSSSINSTVVLFRYFILLLSFILIVTLYSVIHFQVISISVFCTTTLISCQNMHRNVGILNEKLKIAFDEEVTLCT